LGSFEPERGVEYLLQAMATVRERTARPVRLILAWNGGGHRNYESIQQQIDLLGLRPIIDVRGRVDTQMLYPEADVVVIPRAAQERMSFPVRIVEAVHMRTPLIVSRICGMEHLVEGCGLAVEPRNAGALADAILALISDEALHKELSQNCDTVAKRFDAQVSLDKLMNSLKVASGDV
jgi:glycosyltransferase involved in cell wall biosynthesis